MFSVSVGILAVTVYCYISFFKAESEMLTYSEWLLQGQEELVYIYQITVKVAFCKLRREEAFLFTGYRNDGE